MSGVRIEWTTPTINTGCDGQTISEYVIRYHPVGSSDINEIPVQNIQLNITENIDDTVSLTQYEYTIVAIDPNGSNVSSEIKYFTTRNYCESTQSSIYLWVSTLGFIAVIHLVLILSSVYSCMIFNYICAFHSRSTSTITAIGRTQF